MLDFADVVAINKFERRGAEDALRDVGRQMVRNREAFGKQPRGHAGLRHLAPRRSTTTASPRSTSTCAACSPSRGCRVEEGALPRVDVRHSTRHRDRSCPPQRVRYLAEITETVRGYHDDTERYAAAASRVQRLEAVRRRAELADEAGVPTRGRRRRRAARRGPRRPARTTVAEPARRLAVGRRVLLRRRAGRHASATRRSAPSLTRESLSGNKIPRVSLPRYPDHGELVRFLRRENLPGYFPFTAGVFPFKREGEDPARMFAGEGDPFRTNRRFKLLSEGQPATRLSTAFDSVTLYGRDPDPRPDIYGKVGTSGVSRRDARRHEGALRRLRPRLARRRRVSMTINGPAPTILAFFLNTAIDQQVDAFRRGRAASRAPSERDELTAYALANVRGTVQADILKEDQGQNTCLFSHRVLAADDGRHPGVVHRAAGAQLLLGVDLRLPHRRGRGEPHQPARVHPRQRLHLRRGLPRARHGHRRLRAEPVASSSATAWTRSTPCSAGSPAASGRSR